MNKIPSFAEVKNLLTNGNLTVSALTQQAVNYINNNDKFNTFLEVFEQSAMAKAAEVDAKIKQNNAGQLAGMIIGIKDNICYKNHKVSAASKILEEFESLYSATAVERLLAEDAVIIGRLNCDEFAMGSSSENSAYGAVKNPLDTTKVPGGSSGGSAAAVAANFCHVALGSDTGGSIRQPASFCGLVGYKPTYGVVSRYGLIAYGSSLDQIGPFSHNLHDAALVMNVISGPDEYDSTAYQQKITFDNLNSKPTSIAVIKTAVNHPNLDVEIKKYFDSLIEKLQAQHIKINWVNFDLIDHLVPCYNVISNAEASSNLSRYDGVHYGYRSKNAVDLNTTYIKSRTEGFGREVKRRIMLGNFVLSAGYYDAYFGKAQKVRRKIQQNVDEILNQNDLIMLPTAPNTAFGLGQKTDPIEMYLQDIFTVLANLTGNPAISLPMATHSNGLPFGVQFIAKRYADTNLFAFSNYIFNNF